MEEGWEPPAPRWGAAAALALAVLLLSAADAFPLVVLPLAAVLLGAGWEPRWRWFAVGLALWIVGVALPAGPLADVSRVWGALLGFGFIAVSRARPGWGVLPRSLVAIASSLAVAAVALGATGEWRETDQRVREHLTSVSRLATESLTAATGNSAFGESFGAASEQMASLQWQLFPGLLVLQSLAALALVSWAAVRIGRRWAGTFELGLLRELRFADELVWVLIAGLVVLALPFPGATRVGANILLVMCGLYALRGVGVLLFVTGGLRSIPGLVLALLALVFLYPLFLTVTVLVGIGDTWLDLRRRGETPPPGETM